jgi:hypothetical protein
MKNKIIFILLIAFTSHLSLLAQDQKKQLYLHKVEKFTNMRNAGIGLTIGGAILTIAGISTMSNAAAEDPNLLSEESSSKFAVGYLVTVLGVTATGGGITLWAIGGSKKKSYLNKLNSLSLNLNPSQHHLVSLAYRF